MVDLAMCKNVKCKEHYQCYRFVATVSELQWYSDFAPNARNTRCDSFIRCPEHMKRERRS